MTNLLKRYATVVVAFLLMIASLCLSLNAPTTYVKAGPGNGEDGEIKNTEDVYSLLSFLAERKEQEIQGDAALTQTNAALLSSSQKANNVQLSQYKSLTMVEDTVLKFTSKTTAPISNFSTNASADFTRNLTIYLGVTASYYISKGTIRMDVEKHGEGKKRNDFLFWNWDIHAYYDAETVMMQFNAFSLTTTDSSYSLNDSGDVFSANISPEMAGKWVQLSNVDTSEFVLTHASNQETFDTIMKFIDNFLLTGETLFQKDGDIYTFTEENNALGEGYISSMKIDLTKYSQPYIEFKEKGEHEDVLETGRFTEQINSLDTVLFYNIDNTVVKIKQKPSYICESSEDFNNIFIIKESEVNSND